jgi:hypothetical protein
MPRAPKAESIGSVKISCAVKADRPQFRARSWIQQDLFYEARRVKSGANVGSQQPRLVVSTIASVNFVNPHQQVIAAASAREDS